MANGKIALLLSTAVMYFLLNSCDVNPKKKEKDVVVSYKVVENIVENDSIFFDSTKITYNDTNVILARYVRGDYPPINVDCLQPLYYCERTVFLTNSELHKPLEMKFEMFYKDYNNNGWLDDGEELTINPLGLKGAQLDLEKINSMWENKPYLVSIIRKNFHKGLMSLYK